MTIHSKADEMQLSYNNKQNLISSATVGILFLSFLLHPQLSHSEQRNCSYWVATMVLAPVLKLAPSLGWKMESLLINNIRKVIGQCPLINFLRKII